MNRQVQHTLTLIAATFLPDQLLQRVTVDPTLTPDERARLAAALDDARVLMADVRWQLLERVKTAAVDARAAADESAPVLRLVRP